MTTYSESDILLAQCREHAEAAKERQAEMMRIANAAMRKLGINVNENMKSADVGQWHLKDCPIYRSGVAFDSELEKALNGKDAKSPRVREFNDLNEAQMKELIECPICLNIMNKKEGNK